MKFYRKMNKDLTNEHSISIHNFVQELHDNKEITKKTYWFLVCGGERTLIFYMLH